MEGGMLLNIILLFKKFKKVSKSVQINTLVYIIKEVYLNMLPRTWVT